MDLIQVQDDYLPENEEDSLYKSLCTDIEELVVILARSKREINNIEMEMKNVEKENTRLESNFATTSDVKRVVDILLNIHYSLSLCGRHEGIYRRALQDTIGCAQPILFFLPYSTDINSNIQDIAVIILSHIAGQGDFFRRVRFFNSKSKQDYLISELEFDLLQVGNAVSGDTGGELWPSGRALSQLILSGLPAYSPLLSLHPGARILEMGCGASPLPTLVMSYLLLHHDAYKTMNAKDKPTILATDGFPLVVHSARRCAKKNEKIITKMDKTDEYTIEICPCRFTVLDWSDIDKSIHTDEIFHADNNIDENEMKVHSILVQGVEMKPEIFFHASTDTNESTDTDTNQNANANVLGNVINITNTNIANMRKRVNVVPCLERYAYQAILCTDCIYEDRHVDMVLHMFDEFLVMNTEARIYVTLGPKAHRTGIETFINKVQVNYRILFEYSQGAGVNETHSFVLSRMTK